MTNSGGIVKDKTESVWGIKEKDSSYQEMAQIRDFITIYSCRGVDKIQLIVPSGPAFLLLFSHFVAKKKKKLFIRGK